MKVHFNSNPEQVESVKKAIADNGGYCCCKIFKTEDTKCMCKEFREQIKDPNFYGECHCGLYVKEKD